MKNTSKVKIAAAVMVVAMSGAISGCSVANDPAGSCFITVNGAEPEEAFSPSTTTDAAGLRLASVLHSGLVYIDETGQPQLDLADSIEQKTPTLYEVKLRPELQFSDGTPLVAQSFVDAWNYIVAQEAFWAPQFSNILGFEQAAAELPGLKVLSDTTFSIELAQPRSDFLASLAHPAFVPLPAAALTAGASYNTTPVTSGPYRISQWVHSQFVTVVPFENYRGRRVVHNDGIVFQLYERSKKPYEDFQAGKLDVLDDISATDFADYQKKAEQRYVHQAGPAIVTLSIHAETPHFIGEEGRLRRQALSMAIDREVIADDVLDSSHIAATGFVPPTVSGAAPTTVTTVEYNPEQAKQLWRQADAISPFSGTIPIHFSHDIPANQQWGKAVAKQLQKVLGVEAIPVPGADYIRFRYDYHDVRFDGMYRTGWAADYPSAREFLVPNFKTDGLSNDTQYSNQEVDELFDAADAATNDAEALRLYANATEILLADLPAIPLIFPAINAGWNDSVANVHVGFQGFPLYHLITKDSASCDSQ